MFDVPESYCSEILRTILDTSKDFNLLLLRVVVGIIILPYGVQKLLGWFDDLGGGVGMHESLMNMGRKGVPIFVGYLIIIAQSFGSVALILGCLGRLAALANLIIFTGALFVHLPDGWAMNWTGKKSGEGVEYFVMLIAILIVIFINGSGALSMDTWLYSLL